MLDRNPELRQKLTVEAGIIHNEEWPSDARTVVYEPGNGSRYVLHVTEALCPSVRLQVQTGWCEAEVYLVMDVLHGTAMTLAGDLRQRLDPRRVSKELQRSRADGIVLAELIAHVLGCEVQPIEEPRSTGLVELPGVCGWCGGELRAKHKCPTAAPLGGWKP